MLSSRAPRKPRIIPKQQRARVAWCNEHFSCSGQDWSKAIFSDQSNYEMLNRGNRIYFRCFRTDRTRFERSQKRTDQEGDVSVWTFITCHDSGARIIFDRYLNSLKYVDLLEEYLPTALKRFPKRPRR